MIGLVGRRLLTMVPLLLFVTLVVHGIAIFVPGDPAVRIAGENATPEQVALTRERLNLDEPWPVRYWQWLTDAVRGDLGNSIFNNDPVTQLILERMPVTLALTLAALVVAVLFGVPAGMLAALHPNRWPDKLVRAVATVGIAFPGYWLGLLLMLAFSIRLGWFPTIGYTPISEDPAGWLRHITLPAVALGASAGAEVARQLRRSMLDTLHRDFVRTAAAKGLRYRAVLGKHALKHAAAPVVTVLATQVALLLGAAVIIEQTFTIPGVGALAVSSVIGNDLTVVQGIVVVSTVAIVLANLLADVAQAWLAPKTR